MRQDIKFTSDGTTCRGWLTFPADAAGKSVPLILMGHGFGGTRDMRLEPYAERFNAAGFATLIFDYRHFGASEGQPRNLLDPRRELADFHAALAYVRSLPGVDKGRIVLWGTSFGGGLVIKVAAQDGRVAAVVSQCPLVDGVSASLEVARYAGVGNLARIAAHSLFDGVRGLLGLSPHYMPIAAAPGAVGALTSSDSLSGFAKLQPPGFRNEVTARSGLHVPLFRPVTHAPDVTCPALLIICEHDSVAPAASAEKAARLMPRSEVVRFPVGHFDVYIGPDFELSVSAQVDFLLRHVGDVVPAPAPSQWQQDRTL